MTGIQLPNLTDYDPVKSAESALDPLGLYSIADNLPGNFKQQVIARSLLCYWSVHELGESMTALGKHLCISTAAVSKSLRRGGQIADAEELKFRN